MVEETLTVKLDREANYRFVADFGEPGVASLLLDEPPPLGEGLGPNAAGVLAAAVGNCLSASLLFCLQRARVDVAGMHTEATATLARNERGRLRIAAIDVRIEPEVADEDVPRMQRCLDIFEDYCIVTASVRQGIPVNVSVETRAAIAA